MQPSAGLLCPPARESGQPAEPAFGRPPFKHPRLLHRGQERRRGIKGWGKKAGGLVWSCWEKGEQACGGQPAAPSPARGAQPTTVPFSLPAGAKPGETRPGGLDPSSQQGHSPGAPPCWQNPSGGSGTPVALRTVAVPSPAAISLPPSLALQKGGGGWQAEERWERRQGRRAGGKARAQLASER